MASRLLGNRVKHITSTTGTGTVTLGSAFSNAFFTFAEAGIANASKVTYVLEEGTDFEIGEGTYTSAGTTLSRDIVLASKIGGTAGTSKMNLAGAATVRIDVAKEDLDVNTFDEDTAPDDTADFMWMYDASAALKKKVKPTNNTRTGGLQLLTSGSVSAAATLDIVLTSYTGYRGIVIMLAGFVPAMDGVDLWCRFSTDGGATYITTGYNYAISSVNDAAGQALNGSGSAGQIIMSCTTAGNQVGNGANEGYFGELKLLKQQSAAFWSRVFFLGYFINNAATPQGMHTVGGGAQEAAQDTDAIRFLFSSGNIASGDYAVYGLI